MNVVSEGTRQRASQARRTSGHGPDGWLAVTAVERWSQLVVAVACADIDVPTLEDWGRLVRLSSRTLCSRCQAAGARPKDSLDLGRLLRVLRAGDPCNWHPEEYLDIIDPRTFARLLSRGGLDEVRDGVRPSVTQFLSRHRFDLPDVGIEAVRRRLRAGPTILAEERAWPATPPARRRSDPA